MLAHALAIILSGSLAHSAELVVPTYTIKVRAYNRIFDNKKISLIDVVDRESIAPEVVRKIEKIKLGDAPKIGEERVYSSKVIAEAIRQSGVKKEWGIQIPYRVVVENKGYDIDKNAIQKDLIERWSTLCRDCQINIKNMQMPVIPKTLADRPWSLDSVSVLPRGNFSQKLLVTGQDGRSQIFWINGLMEVKKTVPVLMRSTPMNTRFTEDDFQFQSRDITFATDSTPSKNEIIGQQAKYTMNANDIIWRGSIVREKAVQRGEIVKVSVANQNWEISVQARTEQDGYIGDNVNLRNLQSNRIITGRVIGSGEVEIR